MPQNTAINTISGFWANGRVLMDERSGPYDSVADALTALDDSVSPIRSVGLIVIVVDTPIKDGAGKYIGGTPSLYWFSGGVTDNDLVEFAGGGGDVENPSVDGLFARRADGVTYTWEALADTLSTLTDEQITRLKALVYVDLTRSGSATPSTFEKGVATTIDWSYTITPNDDTITSVTWDGVTDSTPPFDLTGNAQELNQVATVSKTLEITISGGGSVSDLVLTSTALTPQWRGVSALTDFTGNYTELNTELTKFVQSGDNTGGVFNMNNEYAYFVSTNANATIKDGNNFTQSIGAWGDGVSEFYKKSITVTLADGSTTGMTIYRTRQTKVASPTYNLS